jgi:hypothetical protein
MQYDISHIQVVGLRICSPPRGKTVRQKEKMRSTDLSENGDID